VKQFPLGIGEFKSCAHGVSINIKTPQDHPSRSTRHGLVLQRHLRSSAPFVIIHVS
jgi:hypothetical protein